MLIAVIISFPFAAEIVLESYEILLPGTLTEAALLASIVAATIKPTVTASGTTTGKAST